MIYKFTFRLSSLSPTVYWGEFSVNILWKWLDVKRLHFIGESFQWIYYENDWMWNGYSVHYVSHVQWHWNPCVCAICSKCNTFPCKLNLMRICVATFVHHFSIQGLIKCKTLNATEIVYWIYKLSLVSYNGTTVQVFTITHLYIL